MRSISPAGIFPDEIDTLRTLSEPQGRDAVLTRYIASRPLWERHSISAMSCKVTAASCR